MIPIARPLIEEEEKAAVLEVLDSGQLAQGPKVRELEKTFAAWAGVPHAIATSSGTAALHMALKLLGVRSGDEVLCSTFTFAATANAIMYEGGEPVFIDSDSATWNMDGELLRQELLYNP